MVERQEHTELNQAWGMPLHVFYCAQCHSAHLTPARESLSVCPACLNTMLSSQSEQIRRERPELMIPFAFGARRVSDALAAWCKGRWLRPAELDSTIMTQRLQRYFLPLWLVDTDVQAVWQAEMGYNYQAASFREHYQGGQWVSQEVTETRTRWEPRLGKLERHYDNVAVPALETHANWMSRLGGYDFQTRKPYSSRVLTDSVVRVPDHAPDAAWMDARSAVDRTTALDCQVASQAEHIRNWSMDAQYKKLNWTQMLVPAYMTYYTVGEEMFPVWINGQSGHISGVRLVSMQKAWIISLVIAVLAVLLFLLGVLLAVVGIGILLILLALLLGLTAFVPPIWAWTHNRRVRPKDA